MWSSGYGTVFRPENGKRGNNADSALESADRRRGVAYMGLFKETVFSGFSLRSFTKVRDILSANNVWYTVKVRDRTGGIGLGASRAVTGSLGMNSDFSKEYEVLVKKEDADKARHYISLITLSENGFPSPGGAE